jgi:hypothetical protein
MANEKNLPAISVKAAVDTITATHPSEAAVIRAAMEKDIRVLGTDECFALRDNSGEIRAFKASLTLSAQNGGLVQPVPGGPHVISAQGYEMWAEASGASVIFPNEVLVDGQWQQNPAVIRDPANRRILCIYARAVAFRFSSKGIPQVSDWTTVFDTPSYRLIDLLGKAKKYPQAFRLLPIGMQCPSEDGGTWASYPFDESTILWVNTAHDEALNWFAQILNREKKAIDFAQTFAKRNALKHLSGLQRAPQASWTIPILCWRPTSGNIVKWDATRYAQLREQVGGLITSTGEAFATTAPPETRKVGSERVSDEFGFEALEAGTDPEDQDAIDVEPVETSQEQEKSQAASLSDEDRKTLANLAPTREMFPEEYAAACAELGMDPNEDVTAIQAREIMKRINSYLDHQ